MKYTERFVEHVKENRKLRVRVEKLQAENRILQRYKDIYDADWPEYCREQSLKAGNGGYELKAEIRKLQGQNATLQQDVYDVEDKLWNEICFSNYLDDQIDQLEEKLTKEEVASVLAPKSKEMR